MKPALSGIQSEKTIIFPVWRDERKHLFSIDDITGAFAMWAVRQSPYPCPDYLYMSVKSLNTAIENEFTKRHDFIEIDIDTLEKFLISFFESCGLIRGWNEPKNKHKATFIMVSRYSEPNPDDDIIDLYALARNIVHTLKAERLLEE